MPTDKAEDAQFRARVSGRVQGVGFRFFVQREALRLGLVGWVRNLADGDLEVVARGSRKSLEELLLRLREGPRLAWVQRVNVDWQQPDDRLRTFEVKPTAW